MSCWGRAQKPPLGVGGIKPGHSLFRVAEPSQAAGYQRGTAGSARPAQPPPLPVHFSSRYCPHQESPPKVSGFSLERLTSSLPEFKGLPEVSLPREAHKGPRARTPGQTGGERRLSRGGPGQRGRLPAGPAAPPRPAPTRNRRRRSPPRRSSGSSRSCGCGCRRRRPPHGSSSRSAGRCPTRPAPCGPAC